MFVFIDESGVHKDHGYSTVVLVYLEISKLAKVEKEILAIEKRLKIKPFHWARHGWKVKGAFLEEILDLNFTLKVAVLSNPIHLPTELEKALKSLITEKDVRKIVIDGKKPRWYERKLKKTLRDKGVSVRKLKTVRSESSAGARLADTLAGLIRYRFDHPGSKAEIFYKKLEKKITVQLVDGQLRG